MTEAIRTPRESATPSMPGVGEWEHIGGLFRSLGSPLRVGIVVLLQERARSVNELVDALGVSQPRVSQHLRVLRSAGVARGTRQGREMIYELTNSDVSVLVAGAGMHARESHRPLAIAR